MDGNIVEFTFSWCRCIEHRLFQDHQQVQTLMPVFAALLMWIVQLNAQLLQCISFIFVPIKFSFARFHVKISNNVQSVGTKLHITIFLYSHCQHFFPYLHIFHLNSVFNNKYIFLLVISKYFMCFGSLISISVAQQLDLTAILKLQTSETSVLCCKVLLAQRQGILSSRNRSWCSASVSVRWYYTGTDCDPGNIRHLLLA